MIMLLNNFQKVSLEFRRRNTVIFWSTLQTALVTNWVGTQMILIRKTTAVYAHQFIATTRGKNQFTSERYKIILQTRSSMQTMLTHTRSSSASHKYCATCPTDWYLDVQVKQKSSDDFLQHGLLRLVGSRSWSWPESVCELHEENERCSESEDCDPSEEWFVGLVEADIRQVNRVSSHLCSPICLPDVVVAKQVRRVPCNNKTMWTTTRSKQWTWAAAQARASSTNQRLSWSKALDESSITANCEPSKSSRSNRPIEFKIRWFTPLRPSWISA